jgi:tetratricopeptide (TPR) repeat protein
MLQFLGSHQASSRSSGRSIVAPLLVAAMVTCLTGCETAPPADRQSLVNGYADYDAHRFTEARNAANQYVTRYPKDPHLDEAFYLRGLSAMALHQSVQATDDLTAAARVSTHPELKGKANRALADLAFDAQHFGEAAQLYQTALQQAPALQNEAAVNYRLGAALQAIGQWNAATEPLHRAASGHGDAGLTARANERLGVTHFALQFEASRSLTAASAYNVKLLGLGVHARTEVEVRGGQRLFTVRSGSYRTYADAAAARDRLTVSFPLVTIVP